MSGQKQDPQKAHLHLRVGTGYLERGNLPAAFRELKQAVDLDPENPVVHNNLALTYFARDKIKKAEEHFLTALSLQPNYSDARNNYGRLLIELNRYDEALEELTKVTNDLGYEAPEKAYLNLGLVYMRKGQLKKAEKSFARALKYNRNFCQAHNQYGQSLFRQGRFKKAARSLDKALFLCKKYDEAHFYSALSYLRSGEKSKALARVQEIMALYPNSVYRDKAKKLLTELKQR